jgi:diadenosine tetraphosphate (Ap4A) HIT family hydrolase
MHLPGKRLNSEGISTRKTSKPSERQRKSMPHKILRSMILFAKKVSKQIKANIFCTKVGMTVVGLEVPHAHIHLIPINSIEDMNFSRPKIKIDSNRLLDLQVLLSK